MFPMFHFEVARPLLCTPNPHVPKPTSNPSYKPMNK